MPVTPKDASGHGEMECRTLQNNVTCAILHQGNYLLLICDKVLVVHREIFRCMPQRNEQGSPQGTSTLSGQS